MDFEEAEAKELLREAGIAVPAGEVCRDAEAVVAAAARLGRSAVKAQVPSGKRGKAGGIRLVKDAAGARAAAVAILGMEIAGYQVERVLVEQCADIAQELYLAVLNDVATKGPMILYSPSGGMDIEEMADTIVRVPVDIEKGFDGRALPPDVQDLARQLYDLYAKCDAELLEINPLVRTRAGGLLALDCKLTIDDAALERQPALAKKGAREKLTALERRARELGLKYIELPGSVGVLANGAGLTMTTMDVIAHCGGAPANFLEIGGDAYTKAEGALGLVLANPRVKSVIINFCGAFARTDVMAGGVVEAWQKLRPTLPVFFSVHGTGEEEAVALIREKLRIEPFDRMEDAVRAAVEAAK
ncbi:MAG TPA: ATP-grasp domain-containing protein [Burkholderiales bacterium]|nr:ATP-grasp domain-containing protein [Burkholderiales bacterium]